MNAANLFLDHAVQHRRWQVEDWLADPSWDSRRDRFLDLIDAYAQDEIAKGPHHLIQYHEAGGNWRIIFPHLRVRPNRCVRRHLAEVVAARQRYVDENYRHGYPDECEVHHDTETFLYFQIPLFHLGGGGSDEVLRSICTVADHCGNWTPGVPSWYDWADHGFVSTWLGTKTVRDRPPFDYQEANHFRLIDLCTTAFVGTQEARYLKLAEDYASRWCEHIEAFSSGTPIPCHILPPGAVLEELGHAGAATRDDIYQIFYAIMACNTAYDIGMALLDLHMLTEKREYLSAFRKLLGSFFLNAKDGRPPRSFAGGRWTYDPVGIVRDNLSAAVNQSAVFVARMALKHDMATGTHTYREPMLAWAAAVDEESHTIDQAACDQMVAAHYYTGDTAWLSRGYAMALRTWAVCEDNNGAHGGNGDNCRSTTRYGSKFMMESLYCPLLKTCDWGTRGNLPESGSKCGL